MPVLEQKFSKVLTIQSVDRNVQYLGNVILSLVVTPRHDKKLAMHISVFMQKCSSRQHPKDLLKLNTFASMCSTV